MTEQVDEKPRQKGRNSGGLELINGVAVVFGEAFGKAPHLSVYIAHHISSSGQVSSILAFCDEGKFTIYKYELNFFASNRQKT